MKKKLLLTSILISFLILVPLIGLVNGGTSEEWTGVEERTYTWTYSGNKETFIEVNNTFELDYSESDILTTLNDISYKMEILEVNTTSDVNATIRYDFNIITGAQSEEITNREIILTNGTSYEMKDMRNPFVALEDIWSVEFITPTNLNLSFIVENWTQAFSSDSVEVSKKGNGIKTTYESGAIDVDQTKKLEVLIEWSEDGILTISELKYGGDVAVAFNLEEKEVDQIPGYGFFGLLGISIIAFIAVAYLVTAKTSLRKES